MNNDKIKKAINEVYNDLKALSKDEFLKLLLDHQNGDIANSLIDSGALLGREIESKAFQGECGDLTISASITITNSDFIDFYLSNKNHISYGTAELYVGNTSNELINATVQHFSNDHYFTFFKNTLGDISTSSTESLNVDDEYYKFAA